MPGELTYRPDPARVADGWVYRFVADAARAEEAVALYLSLGFEAVADPVETNRLDEDCGGCQVVVLLRHRAIYTRRQPGG